MNTQNSLKTIDLNKHTDRDYWAKNQEERIQNILTREFYHNKEYKINDIPRINIRDLGILGYKNPKKAIENLVNRGVVTKQGDIIELVTKIVYCNNCKDREIFDWEKLNHLQKFHVWNEITFKHNVWELEFSSKPFPQEIDHDYKQISELKHNTLRVKCKNCGDERTIYIDHVIGQCDPSDKGIFIENPDDSENIKIRVGSNDSKIVFKNQEELQKFIESKVNGA